MSEKKPSVGLTLFTHIESCGGLVAILQRRGDFNHEKMALESYPGACQPTAHGKVEVAETYKEAICREIREELGSSFYSRNFSRTFSPIPIKTGSSRKPNHFVTTIRAEEITHISLNASTGGLVFVTQEGIECATTLQDHHKIPGIPNRGIIALFKDDREDILEGFSLLTK